ncbi:MAG: pirin family protein [Bradymonadales bacterium]|jgi:redox-sensitive bicupin YhaK (pirin superfamily)
MVRKIEKLVTGFNTKDGAGVKLVRVLGNSTIKDFDPFLMLDSFDSQNPDDYIAGFPMHPHRGIETISYLSQGAMVHRDSLKNSESIGSGELQWMTAGSGIMHEELLPASPRMLGVQLWLNMPRSAKMSPPAYHSIRESDIVKIPIEGGTLRVLCGTFGEHQAFKSSYVPFNYYAIDLKPGASIELETEEDYTTFVFTLKAGAKIAGRDIAEKTAAKLSRGRKLNLAALDDEAELLVMSAPPLGEPVAWGGPIVMNTEQELRLAFAELQRGEFLKEALQY